MSSTSVSVDDLKKESFSDRPIEDRLKIIANGKPRPDLNMAAVVTMTSDDADIGLSTQEFRQSMYDDVKWLTGCEKRQAFFCWPCLLFMPPSGVWNTSGVADLVYYLEAMPQHEQSFEHMQAMLKLQNLIEKNAKTETSEKKQHNDMVKRNRAILKRMIDVVCNLLAKEKHYDQRANGCELDADHVVRNLQFLGNYDVLNTNFIEDAIDMVNITPNLVNDLVDTISKKIRMTVHEEIQETTYVSIILSDHSAFEDMCQFSTVLRYVKNAKPCERFIGFTNIVQGKSIKTIMDHIKNIVEEFSFATKFNSFALDGGIIPTRDLTEFLGLMKTEYPYAFFVPYHNHHLDYVIQQSLAEMKECRAFFKSINRIRQYFQKKSDRYKRFENFVNTYHPEVTKNKFYAKSQYIQILNSQRGYYVSFFDSVVQNSTMWEASDITEALGFKVILEDGNTVWMLEVFSAILNVIAPLNKILKNSANEKNEKSFTSSAIIEVISKLTELRDTKFRELWFKANHPRIKFSETEPATKRIKPDPECLETFCSIINRVLEEINARLKFCQLLHCNEMGLFTYNYDRVRTFTAVHFAHLDEEQMRNELTVLRTNSKVFGQKSVQELSDFLLKTRLSTTFKFLHKLVNYFLTLPIEAPSAGDSKRKFKGIQDWSYVAESPRAQRGDIAVPCIELDYLQELRTSCFFHEEIAVIFHNLNDSFELLFR